MRGVSAGLPLLQPLVIVVHVTHLAWDSDALGVVRALLSEVKERLICGGTLAGVNEETAYHKTSASFARFAMNCSNFFGIFINPCGYVLAKWVYEIKGARVVVLKAVSMHGHHRRTLNIKFIFFECLAQVVSPFNAKIINRNIFEPVALVEEAEYLPMEFRWSFGILIQERKRAMIPSKEVNPSRIPIAIS